MQRHPMNAANAVAIKIACGSIPDAERIDGFTARMYAIVINVVIPATTSVLTFVLFCLSLKTFSNILYVSPFFFLVFSHQNYFNALKYSCLENILQDFPIKFFFWNRFSKEVSLHVMNIHLFKHFDLFSCFYPFNHPLYVKVLNHGN